MSAVWKISPAPTAPETGASAAARPLRKALQRAYRQLDDCIVQMESATAVATPNMVLLANARYRIGQASYARRQLVQEACDFLLARVSPLEPESAHWRRRASDRSSATTAHTRGCRPSMFEPGRRRGSSATGPIIAKRRGGSARG